tara:strand:+ start:369 stop:2033 length:1665 start_codon:yes stop_codon:yes gene_type:complete
VALVVKDRIKETSSTTGQGTLTLGGAVDGFRTFADIGDGNTTYYAIVDGNNFEVGLGTYTASGTTLSRDTVFQTSAGNTTKISCTGDQEVFVTQPADKAVFEDASGVANAIGFRGNIHPNNGATTNYLSLKDSNELNFFNSSNSSIKLYINYDGGDVDIAQSAIVATNGGATKVTNNLLVGTDVGSYNSNDFKVFVSNADQGTTLCLYDDSGNFHSALIKYDTNILSLGLNDSNTTNTILTTSALNITTSNVAVGNTVADTITGANSRPGIVVGSGSGNAGVTVYTGTNGEGNLNFADGTTTTDTYKGYVSYYHYNNSMSIGTNHTTRLYINSDGDLGVGTTNPEYPTHIQGSNVLSGGGRATVCVTDNGTAYNSTNPGGGITFRGIYNSSGSTTNFGTIQAVKANTSDGDYASDLIFTTRANGGNLTEAMRIDNSNRIILNDGSPIKWGGSGSLGYIYGGSTGDTVIGSYDDLYLNSNWIRLFNASNGHAGTTEYARFSVSGNWITGPLGVNGVSSNYGSSGQVLTSQGNASPTWADATGVSAGKALAYGLMF